jgi:hypothetical protein
MGLTLACGTIFEGLNIFIVTGGRTIYDIIWSSLGLLVSWLVVIKERKEKLNK